MVENGVKNRKKGGIIALAVILSIVLTLTIFLTFELNLPNLSIKGEGNKDGAYGFVLANIPGIKEANPRLVDISMLGSHDSNTDQITMKSETEEFASGAIKFLTKIGKGLSYRFAKTQTISVGQQLLQGSRYFHFKYSYTKGDWYATHTLVSGLTKGYILQILEYCDTHPGEIAIIKFQSNNLLDSGKTFADFHTFLADIKYNGKNIYDYVHYGDVDIFAKDTGGVKIGDLRYNDLTLNGTSAGLVLIDSREKEVHYVPEMEGDPTPYKYKFFDLESHSIQPWHARNSSKALMNSIQKTCEEIEKDPNTFNKLRVIQSQACISTKGFVDIINDMFGGSLLHIAEKHNIKVITDERINYWLDTMPVLMADFINTEQGDYNNKVNALMLERNKALVASILG